MSAHSKESIMRWTKYFIPTLKEVPAEAESVSHRLMIRAGLIRKLASGAYTYLPLGLRTLKKVQDIIKEGNARRISIKNEKGDTVIEFPVTIGVVGVVLAPVLAAVGAVAALISNATIVVEKRK